MELSLNTLDSKGPIDYENLSIVTRPRPPRRRQSGTSLVPFRPYVKCLTSVRQQFSFANGYDKWMVMGKDEVFFTQPNGRCIGSLIDDCDISEVIRWDIEGESTRLPMMCKLWMIVDGAVVERGKPHLVQDAAVQVFSAGRNLRAIMAAQQRYGQTLANTTFDRRRRQSWHDVKEYHSVPYYQYTSTTHAEFQEGTQCDIDNEHLQSQPEVLSDVEEETAEEEKFVGHKIENVQETIHHLSTPPRDRAHVSITTQTEHRFTNRSTSVDDQLIQMFNLNLETNEILLSSIANPYLRALASTSISENKSIHRNGIEYKHRSISTADDYPHWWLQLTTDLILSDLITNQNEEKEKFKPSPSPRQDQSVQTDLDKSGQPSSTRSSRIPKSSSSTNTSNHYQFIDETDDGNNAKRALTYSENSQRVDSHSSDSPIENVNQQIISSKQSEADYHTFVISLNEQKQQSYSTPDPQDNRPVRQLSFNDTTRIRKKSSESTSTTVLTSLLERYEKTLRERQRSMAIANEQLLDVDDVLKRYRGKTQNSLTTRSNTTIELQRDISYLSTQSKEDRSSLASLNLIKDKYRAMPGVTSREMIQGYIPTPQIQLSRSIITTPRQRQPRFIASTKVLPRPDYCDLCLTDDHTSSAWIKYNERKVEELQKRIDLMLQIDDNGEEAQLLLPTVTQRIDDVLLGRPRYRSPILYHPDRILLPRRYQYHLPYRLNQSVPSSPRLLRRNMTRSTTPVSKSVRISTQSVPPRTRSRPSTPSASRPLVSILRRSSVPATPRSNKLVESSHVWRSKVDGEMYVLEQFSIPRYYRLYNDVSFREMFHFSRMLDTYLDPNRATTRKHYSTMVKNFALDQQLPSEITSAA